MGEIELDYRAGVLRWDAPATQGAAGDLRKAGEIRLRDVTIDVPMDVAQIALVALDRQHVAWITGATRKAWTVVVRPDKQQSRECEFVECPKALVRWGRIS